MNITQHAEIVLIVAPSVDVVDIIVKIQPIRVMYANRLVRNVLAPHKIVLAQEDGGNCGREIVGYGTVDFVMLLVVAVQIVIRVLQIRFEE